MKPLHPLWRGFSYYPHQEEGIHWMLDKEHTGTPVSDSVDSSDSVDTVYGGLQCDGMGVGKTIQVAAVITHHVLPNTLLLAPLAVVPTWVSVLQQAGCNVDQVINKKWTRAPSSHAIPVRFVRRRPTVYITNYDKLLIKSTTLFTSVSWDRIVLDEAHIIRNGVSRLAIAARSIKAPIRWAVTGTPLVNSLRDIVALLRFLRVPCSPTFRWEPRFLTLLPHLLLHRSLDSLRSILPNAPPVPIVHTMVLPFTTSEEEEFYHGVQGTDRKYKNDHLSSSESFKMLLRLLRLRQLSVHPQIYISAKRREDPTYGRDDWLASSTKLDAIRNILTGSKDSNYLIFCQFHEEMALIRQSLLDLVDEDAILMYHGGLNSTERTAVLDASKQLKKPHILLLQLQAGGVGLNLQEYDRVIFVSPWWTAAMMDQAVARAVRMGQTKTVQVYHLMLHTEKSSSVNIDSLVSTKADQKRAMLLRLFQLCSS